MVANGMVDGLMLVIILLLLLLLVDLFVSINTCTLLISRITLSPTSSYHIIIVVAIGDVLVGIQRQSCIVSCNVMNVPLIFGYHL